MSSNSFLHIVNSYTDSLPLLPPSEEMAIQYPYPLDAFQQHAISAIHKEENVLVTAKTGSGKTLVGEYQIAYSLRKGGRVFYTTPIKSLSNQKFHDLKAMFPSVGIVTGDIKYQPDAAVIIMTTECLRNMLYKKGTSTEGLGLTAGMSLTGLDAVIFDEVHYINNKERGKVWEETMILLPSDVKLILLSATIDGAETFAGWLGELKQKKMHLIPTSHRVVPLRHTVLINYSAATDPVVIMDHKDQFHDKAYNDWLKQRKRICDEYEAHRKRVGDRRRGGYEDPVVKQDTNDKPLSYPAELNAVTRYLYDRELLPALFFVFSRSACEKYAHTIEGTFIDTSDAASVKHIIKFHLHKYNDVLLKLKQYHDLVALLERGIAYHHSGLLPILKEIVEVLFSRGLVKVMFCTETFAVGINMPTRTVVFMDLKKYDDAAGGMRVLATDEYIQMAGRAGRRGKDKEGLVIYLPSRDPLSVSEMRQMMTGSKTQLKSRMDFHYDFLLKTLQSGQETTNWLRVSHDSFFWSQHTKAIEQQKLIIADRFTKIKTISDSLTEKVLVELEEGRQLSNKIKETVNSERKKLQPALEQWKNRHMGPVWLKYQKQYDEIQLLRKELLADEYCLHEMESLGKYTAAGLGFLAKIDFLKDIVPGQEHNVTPANLTLKGILATEVNEGNPILLVDAYIKGCFENLEIEEILLVLAAFVREKGTKEDVPLIANQRLPSTVKSGLLAIQEAANLFQATEDACAIQSPKNFWSLNPFWLEVVGDWLEGKTAADVCASYGIYEGNLYRTLMSLNNLLNELISIATYCQHTLMITKLQTVGSSLLRDIGINDSLYLRI